MAALVLAGGTAFAADLGGNCCADLEERVAELEATTARKGNRVVTVSVYGQVNAGIIWHNRPEVVEKQAKIIDNSNSQTRFGFMGVGKIDQNWSAGFRIEVGLAPATSSDIAVRHAFLYIKSKQFGEFALGQQSTATDEVMEVSLSRANIASRQGALEPFNTFVADQTGYDVVNPFDGSRKTSVKWVSPIVAGFWASASWSDDDTWDAALRFAQEFGAIRIAAAGGFREDGIRQFYGGSASVMHVPSGLFVDGMYGVSDGLQQYKLMGVALPIGDAKLTIMGGRAGIETKTFAMGKTTIFGEYAQLEVEGLDWKPTLWGFGAVQAIDPAAMSIYLSWRRLEFDVPGDTSNVDVVVGGALIKF